MDALYCTQSVICCRYGKFHADILFFGGEYVPNGSVYRPDVKAMGYDYDAIGTDLIEALSVKKGMLVLPSGMSYSVLVMPETQTMSLSVAKKIQQLVNDGATIIASCPQNTNSLTGYPQSQQQLRAVAQSLWPDGQTKAMDRKAGNGRLISGYSLQQALDRIGLKPDFEVRDTNLDMTFIHRVIDDADVYLVSNQQDAAVTASCIFNVVGKKPELWNAQYASISPAQLWQKQNNRTVVTLNLEPEESVFVVFNETAAANKSTFVSVEREGGLPADLFMEKPAELEIVKAEYGVFDLAQCKMVDVTDKLNALVKDSRLTVTVGNQFAGDPAAGTVKKILVEYTYDGKVFTTRVNENLLLSLPKEGLPAGKKLVIKSAVYGDLPEHLTKMPKLKTVDVTDKLSAMVTRGVVRTPVNNSLSDGDPVVNVPKQIKVQYKLDGVSNTVFVDENQLLLIPSDPWTLTPWSAELCQVKGDTKLLVWDKGTYNIKKSDGRKTVVEVAAMPKPLVIDGPWSVSFDSHLQTPKPTVFKKLMSLTESDDPAIKGFSGTTIYKTTLDIKKNMLSSDKQVTLELGRVEVMAHVFVNGRDLGILWKNPYRIDISSALKAGKNELEVRVANLWVNRIIADEAYPEDCLWQGAALAKWPDWFVKNQPRPTKRQTFYTWKHWSKNDPLLPSCLIGPVYIRIAELYPVE